MYRKHNIIYTTIATFNESQIIYTDNFFLLYWLPVCFVDIKYLFKVYKRKNKGTLFLIWIKYDYITDNIVCK